MSHMNGGKGLKRFVKAFCPVSHHVVIREGPHVEARVFKPFPAGRPCLKYELLFHERNFRLCKRGFEVRYGKVGALYKDLRRSEGIGRPELFLVVNRVASEVNASGHQYAYLFRGAYGRGRK